MRCKATLTVEGDADNILRLFEPETKEFQNNRASYTAEKKNSRVEFKVKARDPTALRAVLNSITKNLSVYENSK